MTITRPSRAGDWQMLAELARVPRTDRLILDRPVRVTTEGLSLWEG